MIFFPDLPMGTEEILSGKLCIPEILDIPEEIEGEDPFVQALMNYMAKPMRGGENG